MDHLSACYFCGIALDEPLADYPVVPPELRQEGDRHTVTLCPACHQKLDSVVDIIMASVEGTKELDLSEASDDETVPLAATSDDSDPADIATESTDSGTIQFESDADDAPGNGNESGDTGGADASATIDDLGENPEDDSPNSSAGANGEQNDSEHADADEDDPLASAMEADVPDEFQTAGDESLATDDERDEETEAEAAPDNFVSDGSATGDGGGGDDSVGDAPANSASDGDGQGDAVTPSDSRATISALEYNKVMRLLQNREFPVDRDEIETVAANAYDMARSDCADVIDLAIDRELIGEDDGQLTRPD